MESHRSFSPNGVAMARLDDLAQECGAAKPDASGAGTVSPESVRLAERVVRALPDGIPIPEFAAEPDGSVSLDWIASKSRVFSISVGTTERLPYAWLDGSDHGHGVAPFSGEVLPAVVIDGIAAIMKSVR